MNALSVGSKKGMEQAANLLEDPEYEKTIRERRKKQTARQKEAEERSQREAHKRRIKDVKLPIQ